jgi:ATP-dependent Clp protease ATP-binding subunit ClpC
MVIEVLSDDCVSAVMASHAIGNEIGLTVLRNEVLFAGIVQQPEGAAKTLQKYKLQPDAVKAAAIQQLRNARVDLVTPNSNKDPLPFSSACKQLLEQSLVIAERLDSSSVRSEHVLLALMGYNDGKPIEAAPALDVLQGMKELRGLDGKAFSCFKFCQQLVQDLGSSDGSIRKKDTKETSNINEKEEVVIGGLGGLGTATLSSVGVDLTQMALDGQLDAVYGRNEEIRTCLRTLGRRRKNNPCLIGGMFVMMTG